MVRRSYGRHLWMIALVLLAFALPVAAQDGVLQGTVKDSKGMPIEGAKITIELAGSGRPKEAKSEKSGEFTIIGLVGGAYQVTVSKEGVGTATRSFMVRARVRNNLDVVLAPGAGAADPAMAQISKIFDEGIAASRAGNQDEAISKFEAAIAIYPKCADCFYNIGFSEAQKKDYDKAEAAYKKAIELRADNVEAYNGLANIYNAQKKFDLAGQASAKASELTAAAASTGAGGGAGGGSAEQMYNQGVILWNQGKIADAKKQFQAAIAAKPDHADSHYQLAMALVNEGDLKGAGAEFDTYLKLAPNGQFAAQAKALASQLPK